MTEVDIQKRLKELQKLFDLQCKVTDGLSLTLKHQLKTNDILIKDVEKLKDQVLDLNEKYELMVNTLIDQIKLNNELLRKNNNAGIENPVMKIVRKG